jgi:UDP-glucuronate decarboxylase
VRSCYDEGKRCAETLFFDYHRQVGLEIKVMRIFNTYGPRMLPNDGRVVSNFIVQALRGEPITIYGDGSQTRSFCYVDDLIEGMVRLMRTPAEITGPINVGNPGEFTMLELAEEVLKLVGGPSTLSFLPLPPDDPRQRRPDITLARNVLGWEPRVSLADGLKETVAYFRKMLH